MDSRFTPTLYLRMRKRVRMGKHQTIYLGQIAQMIVDPELEAPLRGIPLYQPTESDGSVILIDMLMIVKKVKERFPDMQIEPYGDPHTLVEIHPPQRSPNVAAIALMVLLLFIGSGLAIMNFHEDVSMREVHRRIYELVTGKHTDSPLLLQIPYSIGLGAGMVLFFNHLFKKKLNEEPSPLEVEMYLYQENVNQYLVTQEYEKLHKGGERG